MADSTAPEIYDKVIDLDKLEPDPARLRHVSNIMLDDLAHMAILDPATRTQLTSCIEQLLTQLWIPVSFLDHDTFEDFMPSGMDLAQYCPVSESQPSELFGDRSLGQLHLELARGNNSSTVIKQFVFLHWSVMLAHLSGVQFPYTRRAIRLIEECDLDLLFCYDRYTDLTDDTLVSGLFSSIMKWVAITKPDDEDNWVRYTFPRACVRSYVFIHTNNMGVGVWVNMSLIELCRIHRICVRITWWNYLYGPLINIFHESDLIRLQQSISFDSSDTTRNCVGVYFSNKTYKLTPTGIQLMIKVTHGHPIQVSVDESVSMVSTIPSTSICRQVSGTIRYYKSYNVILYNIFPVSVYEHIVQMIRITDETLQPATHRCVVQPREHCEVTDTGLSLLVINKSNCKWIGIDKRDNITLCGLSMYWAIISIPRDTKTIDDINIDVYQHCTKPFNEDPTLNDTFSHHLF